MKMLMISNSTDKAQADILDGITAMQATLQTLTSQFGRMDERLTKIEGLAQRPPPLQIKPELMAIDQRPVESYAVNGASVEGTIESTIERTVEGTAEPPPLAAPVQRDMEPGYFANPSDSDTMMNTEPPLPLRMMAEDEIEAEPGPPVPPGEPAIPINHTTLAGLLLDWPDIRELTASLIENEGIKFVGEFPISQEQNRGPLIVHGRGEDGRRQRQTKKQDDYDYIDMADDSSDTASPSPAADFGQARIAFDLQTPGLIVGQVPVEDVELVHRHPVDEALDELGRLIVTGGIQHQTAPGEPRRILDRNGGDDRRSLAFLGGRQLPQTDRAIQQAAEVIGRNLDAAI